MFDEKHNAHNPRCRRRSPDGVEDCPGRWCSMIRATRTVCGTTRCPDGCPLRQSRVVLDGTSGQTMILGTTWRNRTPAFEMDIDALKSLLAITILPVVPTPVAAAPRVPKVTSGADDAR